MNIFITLLKNDVREGVILSWKIGFGEMSIQPNVHSEKSQF